MLTRDPKNPSTVNILVKASENELLCFLARMEGENWAERRVKVQFPFLKNEEYYDSIADALRDIDQEAGVSGQAPEEDAKKAELKDEGDDDDDLGFTISGN